MRNLRRELHSKAEVAHEERETAAIVARELAVLNPDTVVRNLGGHGLAAVFNGSEEGPTVLYRSDLDALPMDDTADLDYRSLNPGAAHKCGHDGHMAIAVGVARRFAARRPSRGRVVILFQPAEETGEGARKVLDDEAFAGLLPDTAFAVHNLPGFPLAQVVIRTGPFACASRGLVAELTGATSHAAEPQEGRSPALAVAQLIQGWSAARQMFSSLSESVQATVIHAAVGRRAFGTSPGEGRVMATLRAPTGELVDRLEKRLRLQAEHAAAAWGLDLEVGIEEPFPATVNADRAVRVVAHAVHDLGLDVYTPDRPFAWSEDFGHFGEVCPSAMIGLGAGEGTWALHHPDYDFPDELLPRAVPLVETILRRSLENHD